MNINNENIELVRLEAKDYEECFALMDLAFMTSRPGHPHFKDILPKMCVPDDEHMHKHLAVRRDGGRRALSALYQRRLSAAALRPLCARLRGGLCRPYSAH